MRQKFNQVADVAATTPSVADVIRTKALEKVAESKGKVTLEDATAQVEREMELTRRTAAADKTNSERTGKGTRIRVGQTRGKNPKVIDWEAFDTDHPEICPASLKEFMEITKTEDEKQIVSYLIDGFNSNQYAIASDVLAEFVEPNWPDALVKQFKATISNYATAAQVSLEDAVTLLKPGIVKAFEKRMAAGAEASK